MSLNIMTQFNAKNWTPAANVPDTWHEGARAVEFLTIHWWGTPVGQTFGGIIDWFCNPQSSVETSAHFVVSAPNVACIVNPDDAAWHAGSADGNVHSVGIECDPRCSDADYQKIAELIVYLWGIYGKVPVVPHNYWTNLTVCPGDYRIDRIVAIANSLYAGTATSTPPSTTTAPTTEGFLMSLTADQQAELYTKITRYLDAPVSAAPAKTATLVWAETVSRGDKKVSALQELADAKTYAGQLLVKPAASFDAKALAAEIVANLPTNQAHELLVELGKSLPKE